MKTQENPRVFATVTGEGRAKADVDLATFQVKIVKKRPTAAAAQAEMRKTVRALERRRAALSKKGMVVEKDSEDTTLTDAPYCEKDKDGSKKEEGFEVKYSLSFATPSLELVSKIRQALSDPRDQNVSVSTPSFSLSDEKKKTLRHRAQQNAADDAQDIFEGECEGFDLKAGDYKPLTMQYSYGSSRGSHFESSSGSSDPIQIKYRQAVIVVTVRVQYVKKANAKKANAKKANVKKS